MATPTIINGDWSSVRQAIRYLDYIKLSNTRSEVLAGLTLTGFSGVLRATAGVVTGNADHSDLANITANQHHSESHTVASHSDTDATGEDLDTLTGGSNADLLHVHSVTELADSLLGSAVVDLQNTDPKTAVYTVPAGKSAIITKIVIHSPSGSLSGGTDFDIGSGANADTWKQSNDLSSMTATTDYMVITSENTKYTLEAAGAVIGILPVTGATADVTATMQVFGILI